MNREVRLFAEAIEKTLEARRSERDFHTRDLGEVQQRLVLRTKSLLRLVAEQDHPEIVAATVELATEALQVAITHGAWQIGRRVFAVAAADETTVQAFGPGILEAIEVPPPDVLCDGQPFLHVNPKIRLDSGEVVWGLECSWGPEWEAEAVIAGRELRMVGVAEERRRRAERNAS